MNFTPAAQSFMSELADSKADREDTQTFPKRPRPILSCLECRRKKLKCDRLLPCDQCKKSGRVARCAYAAHKNFLEYGDKEDHALRARKRVHLGDGEDREEDHDREHGAGDNGTRAENGNIAPITTGIVDDVEDLKARVAKLETVISEQHHMRALEPQKVTEETAHQPIALQDPPSQRVRRHGGNVGMLVAKGNRSRYHAPDQKLPMILRFQEAVQFIQRLSKEPAVAYVMKEVKLARKTLATKVESQKMISWNNLSSVYNTLKESLPTRQVCQVLTSSYFASSEKILRILHQPTFIRKFEAFWDAKQPQQHATQDFTNDAFVPQLVAVVIIASCSCEMTTSLTTAENQMVDLLSPDDLCDLLRSWVNLLSSKRRLELSTIQTQCLILLACQILPSQFELLGGDSAALVMSATTIGLHRDPCDFPNISLYEGELRRRIWMSVVEIDLQISYASARRPMVRHGDYNTHPAARIDDEEIFDGMTDLPLLHALKCPKENQRVDVNMHFYDDLASHVQHRLKIIEVTTNNEHHQMSSEEVLSQGFQLQVIRDTLRLNLRNLIGARPVLLELSQNDILNSILLYVYTVRPLLSMYRQHGFGGLENSAIQRMEEICVESSMDILSFLEILRPTKDTMDHGSKSLHLFHTLCKADIIQAALTMCLAVKRMDEALLTRRMYKCADGSSTWSRMDLINQVHMTAKSLLRRKQDPIHDIRDPLCLSVIAEYLTPIDNPRLKDARIHAGACIIINSYLETLRQSTAKANFSATFTFELNFVSPSADNNQVFEHKEVLHMDQGGFEQDMYFGGSEFDLDGFFDLSFSDDWNSRQQWL